MSLSLINIPARFVNIRRTYLNILSDHDFGTRCTHIIIELLTSDELFYRIRTQYFMHSNDSYHRDRNPEV